MKIIHTQLLTDQQKEDIVKLWNAEYPKQLAYASIEEFEEYLTNLGTPSHYLLVNEAGETYGWFSVFIRDSAKWFAMIVGAAEQGKGYGTQLINRAKSQETELNGWATDHNRYTKYNGEAYYTPLKFYRKNGFEILEDIRFESERLSAVKIQWKRKNKI